MEQNQNQNQNQNPYGSQPYGNHYNSSPYNQNPQGNPYNNNPYGNAPYYQTGQNAAFNAAAGERVQSILTKSFLFMFIALAISAMAAEVVNYCVRFGVIPWDAFMPIIVASGIAELVLVFTGNSAVSKGNIKLGGVLLVLYSIINGITLSTVLLVYSSSTVNAAFVSAAAVFGIMAFIGAVSKKDFGTWGRAGLMILIGIIVVSIVNLLIFRSTVLDLLISAAGLVVFIGLTAYDTQKIKQMAMVYSNGGNTDTAIGMAGALQLYLDFINIFLYLIRIFGRRSN